MCVPALFPPQQPGPQDGEGRAEMQRGAFGVKSPPHRAFQAELMAWTPPGLPACLGKLPRALQTSRKSLGAASSIQDGWHPHAAPSPPGPKPT